MKIGLITIHWANNYGASLQTYASVKVLSRFGEVSLLDYRVPHVSKGMQVIRWGMKPIDILRIGKDILRLPSRFSVIKKFENFTYRLPLTKRIESKEQFEEITKKIDVFVCGSDQIWNPMIVNGNDRDFDETYLLNFVDNKPKFSYASSAGSIKFNEEQECILKQRLSKFTSLSVREDDFAAYLSNLLERDVANVLDPTLLLTHNEWIEDFNDDLICYDFLPKSFILVYGLNKDLEFKKTIDFYKRRLGLKVVAIDQDPFLNYSPDYHVKDASPEDFVFLFNRASFVVTNSFHGLCFSINFNKDFVVTRPLSGVTRVISLLRNVGLSNRYVNLSTKNFSDLSIDWESVNLKLDTLRENSLNYLEKIRI